MSRLLYYDPDLAWCAWAEQHLSRDGSLEVATAGTFTDAITLFRAQVFDAVIADPSDDEILALLSIVRAEAGPIPFILFMEPDHGEIVVDAFNSGIDRYVEKSGDPKARFGALGKTIERLINRDSESVCLFRQNEFLEFLSETAMDFIRMEDDEDIYRYIGARVHTLAPDAFVVLFSLAPGTRHLVVRQVLPEEPARRVAREEFGRDLVGHIAPFDEAHAALMTATLGCNRIVEGVTSAYYGFFGSVPAEACDGIERRLDLGKYYSMGFNCRDGLYGNVTIAVRKGADLPNRELIEAFIRQASVALLRRQARQRLAESEARYRAVVESQHELICRFLPDGTHLVANEAYCRFFGLDLVSIPGSQFAPAIPVDDRAALGTHFRSFSPERPDGTIEHRVVLPDGRVRWLQWSDRAFFDEDGAILEFQSVGRDVTERREAEASLAALAAELDQRVVERTAELQAAVRDLESFTSSVSHDLRAPLRAIDGYLGILLMQHRDELSADTIALVDRARAGIHRANRFIEGLLSLSRLSRQPLALEWVETERMARSVMGELLLEATGRNVEVVIGALPPCRADPEMLRHIYQNLLSNALKFTRMRDPARIEVSARGDGDETIFTVTDNGIGFPAEASARIFDDFTRFHDAREYEGSGIGLPLVRRLVERHGGCCWAEGEPGSGASFFFTLRPASTS